MKVISAKEMSRIENKAFSEGASEWKFMEKAGLGITSIIEEYILNRHLPRVVTLLCGKGNNGGDGYVVARELQKKGFKVIVWHFFSIDTCSPLCQENYHRFKGEGGSVVFIKGPENIELPSEGIIVDALLGTGFRGSIRGVIAWIVVRANESGLPIISIDIPSGLNGNTGVVESSAIKADLTISLGLPKTGFFIEDGWGYTGKLGFVDFGLDLEYIQNASPDFILLSRELITPLLPKIKRERHKYSTGSVVGLSGSKEYPGAPILSGWGALRSGAGIVRIFHPKDTLLPPTPLELIKEGYQERDKTHILNSMNDSSALFMGPGLGCGASTKRLLLFLCKNLKVPCVLDADALNILSTEKQLHLPKDVIMTPHFGEMKRLLGIQDSVKVSLKFIAACQSFVDEQRVTLILKGTPTFILYPYVKPMINPFGNPGMATAGTGDVLTGIVTAFLAQGLSTRHAAMVGSVVHSLAGDSVAQQKTEYSMIASDIIERLPVVFRSFM